MGREIRWVYIGVRRGERATTRGDDGVVLLGGWVSGLGCLRASVSSSVASICI